ncbi:uncharacterized protein LOC111086487 [Limulus polyphemus]|uniref:Uncharacterized protein LOC111086487 n=1 Tax=Limulus polyphemus TaxID=6850 RepID=A0ABM1SNM7_LIMPO|nr:uncharacterized protein LOC111086487 [Limulus polyphemus]
MSQSSFFLDIRTKCILPKIFPTAGAKKVRGEGSEAGSVVSNLFVPNSSPIGQFLNQNDQILISKSAVFFKWPTKQFVQPPRILSSLRSQILVRIKSRFHQITVKNRMNSTI